MPTIVCLFVGNTLGSSPVGDFSTWYASTTILAVVVFLALTAYAFHSAVAGRASFGFQANEAGMNARHSTLPCARCRRGPMAAPSIQRRMWSPASATPARRRPNARRNLSELLRVTCFSLPVMERRHGSDLPQRRMGASFRVADHPPRASRDTSHDVFGQSRRGALFW